MVEEEKVQRLSPINEDEMLNYKGRSREEEDKHDKVN